MASTARHGADHVELTRHRPPISPRTSASGGGRKRRRTVDSHESPTSSSHPASPTQEKNQEHSADRTRSHVAKRACNECRQQKLRCDVVVEPEYHICSRCRRLNLTCRIDANFKRVDKRSRHVEMENEIHELRQRLADKEPQGSASQPKGLSNGYSSRNTGVPTPSSAPSLSELHQGAADSLLELRHSTTNVTAQVEAQLSADPPHSRKLQRVVLSAEQIKALFTVYFEHYHPFIPILDASKPPDHFFQNSELLFWTVIAVAARRWEDDETLLTGLVTPLTSLVWSTVAEVPQNYHVVKALCLLCTWPLPTKTSSKDPTFMFAGLMMQIALQTGLHRPSHVQEYSRVKLDLREDDILDRLMTWAGCNIVSQTVSTGWGQPPRSQWDYTLTTLPTVSTLPSELYWRLQIERLCNKVSRLCYMNRSDPIGLARDEERPTLISILSEDYRDLEAQIAGQHPPLLDLHLQAVGLHLKLCAFFDSPSTRTYKQDLHELYSATVVFLKTALESPSLPYVGMYIMQMILGGGFTLAKLLNSFFKSHTDVDAARALFNRTIKAIRTTSIYNNDLPARLAEVLTQLWRSYGASMREPPSEIDDSLQLRVRCRMSLSVVYDSVWRWREQFVFKDANVAGTIAALEKQNALRESSLHPAVDSLAADDHAQPDLTSGATLGGAPSQMLSMGASMFGEGVGDWNYEVFDPLMSMLDHSAEFPYTDAAGGPLALDGSDLFT
ncbi:MAG: hypothetical protein Q9162_003801 [Coniocarpon cinnabarinum]